MSVKSVTKSPKKRDFARLYWKDEDSLFIRREKKRRDGLNIPRIGLKRGNNHTAVKLD